MLIWMQQLIDLLKRPQPMKYEIIALGFDGNWRRIGHLHDSKVVAEIMCFRYENEWKPFRFHAREVSGT